MQATTIHQAAATNNSVLVCQLLKQGIAYDSLNRQGDTALHVATRHGHLRVAELLLAVDKQGTTPSIRNKKGHSPLMIATVRQPHDSLAMLTFLLQHRIQTTQEEVQLAFRLAVDMGRVDAVALFLRVAPIARNHTTVALRIGAVYGHCKLV